MLLELALYHVTWPALPPIVIVPFISCFFMALTIPFSRNQWAMGLLASIITIMSTGAVLPGPFVIPLYGFIFQSRMVELSGAVVSAFHVIYSIFLAPLVFAVAPGKVLYSWLMAYAGSFNLVVIIVMVLFAIGGILAALAGRRLGERVSRSIRNNRCTAHDH